MKVSHTHSNCVTRFFLIGLFFFFPYLIHGQNIDGKKATLAYHGKAIKHMHHNELGLALKALHKASRVAEENDDIKGLLNTYLKFAIVNLELDDVQTALFFRDRSAITLKGMQHPFGEAYLNYIEARLHLASKKPFQALEYLESAKELSNNKNLRNNIQLTEANIYAHLQRFDDAEKNYNALLINSDEFERAYLAAKANMGLANIKLQQGILEKSATYAESAQHIAERNNFNLITHQADEFLTMVYEKMGQYDKSLQFQRKLTKIRDSLFTIEKLKEATKVAQTVRNEQKDNEIQQLRAENEELLESENRLEWATFLAIVFVGILLAVVVLFYRNSQMKRRTNDLLQGKNTELEKARDDAISAMKAKSNFLSTVTHELRTPLYAVTGLTRILLEEDPADHQKEHLKSLKFSGEYLLNFISDILEVNKIDADKVEVLRTEFKLKKILSEVIESLQQNASEQRTNLLLNFDHKIPANLMGDPMKLSQIFMNLVGNALKFTKGGQVEVIAKLMTLGDEKAKIYFAVKDTGIGISEEKQKTIFESFEQGSIQINREYGGTGLGLTIVKSLLGLFGSKIQLESKLGMGSTFFFELPFDCADPMAIKPLGQNIAARERYFAGLHVLIVEDNKINQVITKKMLIKKEMTCDIANNGFEAVEMARKNEYDCILMDIHMPGMGGTEATIEIRKFDRYIPIIALTAISMEDSVDEFIAAGCNDVVTKPFKPEVFYQKIGENVFRSIAQVRAVVSPVKN